MLETEIRDLFQRQVASDLPVARVSIAEAHRAARRRLRLRRAAAAVSPLIAAVAVLAIAASGSALTGAGRAPAGPGGQPAAPRQFSSTRSYVRLTWLPGRSAVTQYRLSSASDGLDISSSIVWDFGAMAAGQCQLRHRTLSCPVIRGLPLRRVAGLVGGRPMYLSVLGINVRNSDNLLIQIVAGAIGGNGAGAALKELSLGALGNTIAGAIGGGAGGQLLSALIPALASASGTTDIGALAGQAVGGGVSGAILTAIVGLIKNKMT